MEKGLYRVGAWTALVVVLVVLLDFGTAFSEGTGVPGTLSAVEWFTLFEDNWFVGLGNLGLFNMLYNVLMVPTFLALFAIHRRAHPTAAALATVFWLIGVTIYIASNTALPMLALSHQYAAATTESHRSLLVAAGQAILARGEDLTPGAFPGFLITELAAISMCAIMLRSQIFSKLTAVAGIVAFGSLLLFNILVAFVPAMFSVAMVFATSGGLIVLVWYVLVARRLFKLGSLEANTVTPGRPAHILTQ